MGSSTLITDYVGQGVAADRPSAATLSAQLPANATAIYAETDTGNTYVLIAGAVQVNGGGGGGGPQQIGFCNPTGHTGFGGGNYCLGRVYCVEAITINSIQIDSGSAVSGADIVPCVYADNNGVSDGALLAQGPMVPNVTLGLNTFPLSASLVMSVGQYYWVGIMVTESGISISQGFLQNTGYAATGGATTPPSTGPNISTGDGYLVWGSV